MTSIHGNRAAGWMMTLWTLMGERRRAKMADCIRHWRTRPMQNKDKEFCKHGHPLSGDNVSVVRQRGRPDGRRCVTCGRIYQKRYKDRLRDRLNAMNAKRRRERWQTDSAYRERERVRSQAWHDANREYVQAEAKTPKTKARMARTRKALQAKWTPEQRAKVNAAKRARYVRKKQQRATPIVPSGEGNTTAATDESRRQ